MEDVLTSNVFGLLGYLGPHAGLIPFLACSKAVDGSQPLRDLICDSEPDGRSDLYQFWPRFSELGLVACEPDLLLRIDFADGRRYRVLIESKYRSGKSSEAEEDEGLESRSSADQLARQWSHLQSIAERESAQPYLIYLTAHISFPKSEIAQSIAEVVRYALPEQSAPSILFLSWREIPRLFARSEEPILVDLRRLMLRLNLRYFSGLYEPQVIRLEWRFSSSSTFWFPSEVPKVTWSFRP